MQYNGSVPGGSTAAISFPPSADNFRYVIVQQQFDDTVANSIVVIVVVVVAVVVVVVVVVVDVYSLRHHTTAV